MSIRDLISLPESKALEFKETMPNPEAIAKTACGFANGGGGSIIIGVTDKDKNIIFFYSVSYSHLSYQFVF